VAQTQQIEWITLRELTEKCRVSRDSVMKWVADKSDPLPCRRFGRRWLFVPAEVDAWMQRRATGG
jgi:excisionase family DNA binding protein